MLHKRQNASLKTKCFTKDLMIQNLMGWWWNVMSNNNELRSEVQKKWITKKRVDCIIAINILLIICTTSGCSFNKQTGETSTEQLQTTKTEIATSSKSVQTSSNNSIENQKSTESNLVVYENTKYGFSFSLPSSWKKYSIVTDVWKAIDLKNSGNTNENGEIIYIRHPEWKSNNQRQDIPIMILTIEQWNLLQKGEIAIGAAPVGPNELSRNSKYVFALPARYNFSFLTGFEEVEQILNNKPLQSNENFK